MVSYNVTKANLEATKKVRITYIQQLQFSKRYARANSFLRNAFEGKKMFSSCNVYFEEAFFLKGVFLPPPPPSPFGLLVALLRFRQLLNLNFPFLLSE